MCTTASRLICRVCETPFSTLNCCVSLPAYQRRNSERERKAEKRMRRRVV
jgi:hypothetical protein